jgi:hypothetical protein
VSRSLTLGGRKKGRTTCVPISWSPEHHYEMIRGGEVKRGVMNTDKGC